MKAIYINLDPYLAAVAAWLKGGKSGPAPTFNPTIPLAVTIPLGCDVGVAIPGMGTAPDEFPMNEATIDGQTVVFGVESALPEHVTIAYRQTLGLSALVPSAQYAVVPWDAWVSDNGNKVELFVGESDASGIRIPFTVLVRREQASGPVDLVDFTPPAAAIAAGTDLKGATFDGNEIVAAETTGALSAPAGA